MTTEIQKWKQYAKITGEEFVCLITTGIAELRLPDGTPIQTGDVGRDYVLNKPQYSHRNGETANPEVNGHYWVEINKMEEGTEVALWYDGQWVRIDGYPMPAGRRIWGPIEEPRK